MILMYHNIAGEPLFYSSTAEEFADQMRTLGDLGVEVVPVDRYLDALEAGVRPSCTAVLTFDDAYASFAARALPVLERYGYPATVFAPTAHLGGFNHWDEQADPERFRILTAEALQTLAAHPLVTVGSHGVTHSSLGAVGAAALEHEICGSRRHLEDLLETEVTLFAFPYGQRTDVPAASRGILKRCGYRAAFTTEWTRAPHPADLYALGRMEITTGDDAARFARKLFGKPDTWRLRQHARNLKSLFT